MQLKRRAYGRLANFSFRVFSHLDRRARHDRPPGANPSLEFHVKQELALLIREHLPTTSGVPRFLDVGGRRGEYRDWAEGYSYEILENDRDVERVDGIVFGDICGCPEIATAAYDVVFSNNVFEHLKEPWTAAEECVRLLKPGGLTVHIAPFAWRYHPAPVDCFRFTHEGMRFLFERTGQVETLLAGYDVSARRQDRRGKRADLRDTVPVDELGGFRENWLTVYAARKLASP